MLINNSLYSGSSKSDNTLKMIHLFLHFLKTHLDVLVLFPQFPQFLSALCQDYYVALPLFFPFTLQRGDVVNHKLVELLVGRLVNV